MKVTYLMTSWGRVSNAVGVLSYTQIELCWVPSRFGKTVVKLSQQVQKRPRKQNTTYTIFACLNNLLGRINIFVFLHVFSPVTDLTFSSSVIGISWFDESALFFGHKQSYIHLFKHINILQNELAECYNCSDIQEC